MTEPILRPSVNPDLKATCGNVSEYITQLRFGETVRRGVQCRLPKHHADRYHATADGRHEWHVDYEHFMAALADREARIEALIAALREAREKWLEPCEVQPDGTIGADFSCYKHPNSLCQRIDALLPREPQG